MTGTSYITLQSTNATGSIQKNLNPGRQSVISSVTTAGRQTLIQSIDSMYRYFKVNSFLGAALMSNSSALARHETPSDTDGDRASTSHGVPVYLPACAPTKLYCMVTED